MILAWAYPFNKNKHFQIELFDNLSIYHKICYILGM